MTLQQSSRVGGLMDVHGTTSGGDGDHGEVRVVGSQGQEPGGVAPVAVQPDPKIVVVPIDGEGFDPRAIGRRCDFFKSHLRIGPFGESQLAN